MSYDPCLPANTLAFFGLLELRVTVASSVHVLLCRRLNIHWLFLCMEGQVGVTAMGGG